MRSLITDRPPRRFARSSLLTWIYFFYCRNCRVCPWLPPFFPSFYCPSSLPPLPYSTLVLTLHLFLPFFLPYSVAYIWPWRMRPFVPRCYDLRYVTGLTRHMLSFPLFSLFCSDLSEYSGGCAARFLPPLSENQRPRWVCWSWLRWIMYPFWACFPVFNLYLLLPFCPLFRWL